MFFHKEKKKHKEEGIAGTKAWKEARDLIAKGGQELSMVRLEGKQEAGHKEPSTACLRG